MLNEKLDHWKNKGISFIPTIISSHPLISLFFLGLFLRMLVSVFISFTPDVGTWGVVIENYRAGAGLYDYSGYYYPPIWGYVLSLEAEIMDVFLDIPVLVYVPPDSYVAESFHMDPRTPVWSFAIFIKTLPIIMDVVVGWLSYILTKQLGGTEKKALVVFFILMVFPTGVFTIGLSGMFDPFVALCIILSIMALRSGHYCMTGVLVAIATMTKFFPLFLAIPILFFIFKKQGELKQKIWSVAVFLSSLVIVSLLILVPQILEGTVEEAFHFILYRVSTDGDLSNMSSKGLATLAGFSFGILVMLVVVFLLFRKEKDEDKSLILSSVLIMGTTICISYHSQYLLQILPLIVISALVYHQRIGVGLTILSIAYFFKTLYRLPVFLIPLAKDTDLLSMDSIYHLTDIMLSETEVMEVVRFFYSNGNYLQILGIVIILLGILWEVFISKKNRSEGGSECVSQY